MVDKNKADGLNAFPLRFRVWDKERRIFLTYPNDEGRDIDIFDVFNLHSVLGEYFEDDVVISQDTGLKDKNGESIYIGDIVRLTKTEYDHVDRVESIQKYELPVGYENGHTSLKVERPQAHGGDYWILLGVQRPEELEIIGNIWENPGLLEVKNNEI